MGGSNTVSEPCDLNRPRVISQGIARVEVRRIGIPDIGRRRVADRSLCALVVAQRRPGVKCKFWKAETDP